MRVIQSKKKLTEGALGAVFNPTKSKVIKIFTSVLIDDLGFSVDEDATYAVFYKNPRVTLAVENSYLEFISTDKNFQKPFKAYYSDIKEIRLSQGMRDMVSLRIFTNGGSEFGAFLY